MYTLQFYYSHFAGNIFRDKMTARHYAALVYSKLILLKLYLRLSGKV
jgi:hypothetical protein